MRRASRLIQPGLVVLASLAAKAHAEDVGGGAETQAQIAPGTEINSRWSLGARGFGGGLFSEDERVGGGGGSLLLALGVVPERWELELGVSVIAARDRPSLGVLELVGKRLFELRGSWSPHIVVGPVFSLDFGGDLEPTGGLVAGSGMTYWATYRLGIVGDAVYRALFGARTEQIVTLAAGMVIRL